MAKFKRSDQTSSYDENLRHRLAANNPNEGIILNCRFNDWVDYIAKYLSTISSTQDSDQDKRLLALCRDHAKQYQQPKKGEFTIMLTHPLYLHLTHMHRIESENIRTEAGKYLDALLNLLRLNHNGSKISVLVKSDFVFTET